jgi:hypothetical protein
VFPNTSFSTSTIRTVEPINTEDGAYIAGGGSGKIATSFDRITWVQRVSTFGSSSINDIYISQTSAVAVGNSGKIAISV